MRKKRNDKKSMSCLTPKPSQNFFVYHIQNKGKDVRKKAFKEKVGAEDWTKNRKVGFLTALSTAMKKNPTTSIRKLANELKVHQKTVKTAIKQDLNTDLNSLDYAMWGVLENKTNAISHLDIGSL